MAKARIIARNLVANWVGHGANLVVMFFLSPFVIHTLGLTGYGLWSVLNVLVGHMGLLDLGIRASTGRHIILYIGRGDHESVDETIRTGLGFFSAIGIAFIVTGLLLGWTFPCLFPEVPPEFRPLLRILLPIMSVNMWVSMFRSVLASVLSAHDRFDLARGLDLATLALQTISTIVTLNLGHGITGLVFVVVGCNVIGLFGTFLLAKRVYPTLHIWPPVLLQSRLRELFGYGIPAAISNAAIKIMGQTDVLIVGACLSFGAAGIYTTGALWLYYSATFVGQIGMTFFPPLQRAVARGEMGSARWLFLRQVRLYAICGLPMFIGFAMFGRGFLYLWIYDPQNFSHEAIEAAAWVMVILAGANLLYLFFHTSQQLLAAMGLVRYNATVATTEAVLNVVLSLVFVLVFGFGLVGVALGTLVARLAGRTFCLTYMACRKSGINWSWFLSRIGGTMVIVAVLFAAVCYLILWLWPTTSWMLFALQVALALVCYVPIAGLFLVPKEDLVRIRKSLTAMSISTY